jgi:crossover junction endonuclease MUS81
MAAPCGNPILLQFLQDWYTSARDLNEKKAPGLKKALESMRACPIPFAHPSEAQQLAHIGPKLVERLTTAMTEYCITNGLPAPVKPRGAKKRSTAAAIGDHLAAQQEEENAPKRRRTAPSRMYVPAYRSGGWAILLALHEAEEEGGRNFIGLHKEALIERAQPYCNTSFDAPEAAGGWYTAWNSVNTLLGKNYVYVNNRPKRYRLTEMGMEVADGIVQAEKAKENDNDGAAPPPPARSGSAASRARTAVRASPNLPGRWEESEVEVEVQNNTIARGNARASVTRESVPRASVVSRSRAGTAVPSRTATATPGNAVFAEMGEISSDEDVRETSEQIAARRRRLQMIYKDKPEVYGATSSAPSEERRREIQQEGRSSRNLAIEDARLQAAARPAGRTASAGSRPPAAIEILDLDDDDGASASRRTTTASSSRTATATATANSSRTATATATGSSRTNTNNSTAPEFAPFTPVMFKANTFTVELILDNREVRSKTDRDYIQNNLSAANVTPQTRKLEVGDAMWIARSHETGQEILLDFIVERKRLDDLVSSIKDGRFHEQKFRLTKSGLKNVIYIVEEFTVREAENMQESILTAISSTQVVNGFFVKRTAKLDDTIRYLVRMTKMLRSMYLGKDLYIVPDSHVEAHTYAQLREHIKNTYPGKDFYLRYETFSQLVTKGACMTLRDLFLKMLMCVRGISAEKALEIQRSFKTPAELLEAYEKCRDSHERDNLVAEASKNAVMRRKIPAGVSKKVREVWWGM